jgi:DNA helicase-2/ATP-dependent DNA helicase PcrA
MQFYADLHTHSSHSRATSKRCTLEYLHAWGQRKGIHVIGTGDCLHPAWFAECRNKLHDEGNGLFSLKKEYVRTTEEMVPFPCAEMVRFMLSVEISNIYKKDRHVRKIHNVVCFPSFASAEKTITRLERIGNLKSDGRPILGLDSRDLLEIVLESDPHAILIPAHIWTPWFSVLGSKSGFDTVEECYGDLTKYIYAVETGLSSDPPMNWRLSRLDPFALVSFSDAHSPSKLGRECTIFNTDLSYEAIRRALADQSDRGLMGTIEFFPEEGKYHVDGHRKCGVRFTPEETIAHKGICPVCDKPLTIGVMSRVEELADRKPGQKASRSRPYRSLIPLNEIIAQALDTGPESKAVVQVYQSLVSKIGSEFTLLLATDVKEIAACGGDLVAEGIRRMRAGEVAIAAGYDGEFGTIKLFTGAERSAITGQENLFAVTEPATPKKNHETSNISKRPKNKKNGVSPPYATSNDQAGEEDNSVLSNVNEEQKKAITHAGQYLLIVAGPGTGKTHTLTRRIAFKAKKLNEGQYCCALTFTCKAAEEMKERLGRFGAAVASRIFAGTIHAFCLNVLREHTEAAVLSADFAIASPEDADVIAREAWPDAGAAGRRELLGEISRIKSLVLQEPVPAMVRRYDSLLVSRNLVDFDTVLQKTYQLFSSNAEILKELRRRYPFIFIDEYQDINGIQHALIRLLAGSHGSVTAIGDPHQSIYGFRGSEVRFFESFVNDFPGAQVVALTENYRTSDAVLTAFGQLIDRSPRFNVPPLVATIHTQGRLTVHTAPTGAAEAEYVVHEIEKLVGGVSMFSHDSGRVGHRCDRERGFSEIAVLYRINALRRDLEEAFGRSGIPFTVTGEKPFHAEPQVARLLTLLRFSAGESLSGDTLCGLLELTPEQSSCLSSAITGLSKQIDKTVLVHMLSLGEPFPASMRRVLTSFLNSAQAVAELLAASDLPQALSVCATLPSWKNNSAASPEAAEIRERLARIARTSASYRQFMDTVLLQREEDGLWGRAEAVSLMTLHASKGLEWPVVFIVGCEDHIIPLVKKHGLIDRDEERRLLYVGMSRAKEILYLTNAKQRYLRGEKQSCVPSPFLSDIEENLKNYDLSQSRRKNNETEQLSLF